MKIRIHYQLRDEATPRVLELAPDDYFDPVDAGETLSVRSVPRLLNTYEYTPYRADQLRWAVVEITDGKTFWRVRTQLIDGMRTLMHHSQESDGSEEIIHSTEFGPQCWHVVRTLKQAGQTWAVVMNGLTVERPVTFADSRDFCELWTFEELKQFGTVR